MNILESTTASDTPQVLARETDVADCIRCSGERAEYEYWQTMREDGLNEHWSIHCPDCGFKDTDAVSTMENNRCQPA